jgi:hypothetical protein
MSITVPTVGSKITAAWGSSVAGQLNTPFRAAGSTFSTDLASSGVSEVVGYSQAVALTSGARYRVYFKGFMNAGAAATIGEVVVRYSTAALSTSSTLAGTPAMIYHATASTSGRGTLFFFSEFVAPSTNTFNIGVGVLVYNGTGPETILGSAFATEITIDQVG